MYLPLRKFLRAACAAVVVLFAPVGGSVAGTQKQAFVPVLIYHHVKLLKPGDNAIERGLTISPAQFKAELQYLSRNHYHVLTAAQLAVSLSSGHTLPARAVVLTFDDGYADLFANVYRLLLSFHLRATFFVVPGFLSTPRYLSWGQIATMHQHGMDIEAHTMSHPDLTKLTRSRVQSEVRESRIRLQRALKSPTRVFAYPYGAYNPQVVQIVRQAGFLAAFTTNVGWWQNPARLLTLPRLHVDADDALAIFAGRLKADRAVLAQDPL